MSKNIAKLFLCTVFSMGAIGWAAAEPSKELHIMSAGGESGVAWAACVDKPLLEKYGIKVVNESPAGLPKLKAMVESGTISHTVFDLGTEELENAKASGLLEKLDYDKIKPFPMYDEAKSEYGIGTSYFSTIMSWREGVKAPANWVDFFDTVNFPGKRGLPDYPGYVLPFAALGDGVKPEELFPLDLDRAFKTLERVKDDTIWWQAGSQPPQLLKDKEVDYAIAWSGRVVGKEKDGIHTTFQDGMLDIAWYGIAKGADPGEVEAAYLWFQLGTDPKVQACIANYISYTGPSPELDPLLPKERLSEYPTTAANKKVQWLANAKWWLDNAATVEKRWQEFKLKQ